MAHAELVIDSFAGQSQLPPTAPNTHALRPEEPSGLPAVAVGRLRGFDWHEQPLIDGLKIRPGIVASARSTMLLSRQLIGREVLVVFEDGDAERPIVVGVLEPAPLDTARAVAQEPAQASDERCIVEASQEIVLRCGDASITLTKGGKVLIKGTYVLSRSSGYNKLKGAAVEIN
jgi:hypothetical protein